MKTLVFLCVLVAGTSAGTYYTGNYGPSGIVKEDGNNVQFTAEEASNVLLVGPSGVVMKDGNNKQRLAKRSTVGFVNEQGSVGISGVVRTDGTIKAFPADVAHNIVLISPSGVVTKDGKNIQFDRNLHFRKKRATDHFGHYYGPSGIVTKEGKQFQLAHGVTVLIKGAAAAVLDNGEIIEFY